jgi:hypothetical protein
VRARPRPWDGSCDQGGEDPPPLSLARDSLLPRLVDKAVEVAVKTGELDTVDHEVAWLDDGRRSLAIAVCTSPPARPDRVAAQAAAIWDH